MGETQDDEMQDARPEGIDFRLMVVDFGFLKGLSGYPLFHQKSTIGVQQSSIQRHVMLRRRRSLRRATGRSSRRSMAR